MTNETLFEAMSNISDKHIAEAKQETKTKKTAWLRWGALAACICLIAGVSIYAGVTANSNKADQDKGSDFSDVLDTGILMDFTTSESRSDWGVVLSAKNITSTGLTLVVSQSGGQATGHLITGTPYRLVTLVGETWEPVEELPLPEGVDGRAWDSLAYNIMPESSTELKVDWNWIYGELPSGTYRLEKCFLDMRAAGDYDTAEFHVEFTIE